MTWRIRLSTLSDLERQQQLWMIKFQKRLSSVRLQTLMDVQNEISYELNKPMEGQVFDIIVEGPSPRDEDMWFGRTSGNKMVLFPKDDSLTIGQTVPAHIDKAQTWVCYGSIVK